MTTYTVTVTGLDLETDDTVFEKDYQFTAGHDWTQIDIDDTAASFEAIACSDHGFNDDDVYTEVNYKALR